MTELRENRPIRVRIAPSPTGNCHVGTARNALYNLLYARQHGGSFILRIDDTDLKRSTEESERGVLEGLRWLGLGWDEGPDVSGPYGPYRQSERLDLYRESVHTLLDEGKAYHCFCTPEELAEERRIARANGKPFKYSGRCRNLSEPEVKARLRAGKTATVRLEIVPRPMAFVDLVQGPIEQDAALIGDPIILRANGIPTYHFATVVNEHAMRISHVLRSAEHISNTFPQLQIYQALGYQPPAFGHLGLLLNPDRSKISKRAGAVYIGEFRDQGYLPEAMVNHLALSGWNPGTEEEIYTFDELLDAFSLARCARSNAIFDYPKLLWLNGYYIRQLTIADLTRRIVPRLADADLLPSERLNAREFDRLVGIVALEQERLKTLAEAPEACAFFFRDPDPDACVDLLRTNRFAKRHTLTELHKVLAESLGLLERIDEEAWTASALSAVLDDQTEQLGWKRAELLMPVRIAVSGRTATPPLFETLEYVGARATLRRLQSVLAKLPGEGQP
jgi:glutamyl-tRNA synthetase